MPYIAVLKKLAYTYFLLRYLNISIFLASCVA